MLEGGGKGGVNATGQAREERESKTSQETAASPASTEVPTTHDQAGQDRLGQGRARQGRTGG